MRDITLAAKAEAAQPVQPWRLRLEPDNSSAGHQT